jgi:glycosyltransferase involved in cell wall biosynthesis
MLKPFGNTIGMFQSGLVKYMLRHRPDAITVSANPRYLSFWIAMFAARCLGIPFYAHGVAFFKRQRIGFGRRLMMRLILRLVTSYIAYAPIVRESLARQGFCLDKVSVVPNSMVNQFAIPPEQKTGKETGILFVGRLRRGSGLSLLIQVIRRLKGEGSFPFALHIVGNGEEADELRRQAGECNWISWYGEAYGMRVSDISRECLFGCYPGNSGLSVVHMMSLSLPVVTHNDMSCHEGPEPAYVRDGVTGTLFDQKHPEQGLYLALRKIGEDPNYIARMQRSSFEGYYALLNPSYAERLWSIVKRDLAPARNRLSVANK